jgi:hypothetical protein
VRGYYNAALDREPAASELTSWVSEGFICSPDYDLHPIAKGILGSSEMRTIQVTADYHAILGRAPDPGGLSYWVTQPEGSVQIGLSSSQEFLNKYPLGNAFVSALYNVFLARPPNNNELTYWVGKINGGMSASEVSYAIVSSTEYRTDLINGMYNKYLGRSADAAGVSNWLNQWPTIGFLGVEVGITGSAEFYYDRAPSGSDPEHGLPRHAGHRLLLQPSVTDLLVHRWQS